MATRALSHRETLYSGMTGRRPKILTVPGWIEAQGLLRERERESERDFRGGGQ
jgi:hypothetical protein